MTGYSVKNDILYFDGESVNTFTSPHVSSGRCVNDLIVIHFTGGGRYTSSLNWARDPSSKVSWDIIVGRGGEVEQNSKGLRAVTWHAGRSEYYAENIDRTYSNINKYGIGIELANYGKVERVGDEFKTAYGQNIAPENVYQHEDGTCWEQYTEAQIQETFDIALALARRYSCVDIVGHEEISPGRKIDPGPAFPLQELKDTLYAQSWYKWEQDNE